jgi:hypothetical protein
MREEVFNERINMGKLICEIATSDLWSELARRLNIKFGKIQMAIHEGKPTKFANIDIRVSTEESELLAR